MASGRLQRVSDAGRWLLVVAARAEAEALLDGLGAHATPPEPWRPIECADHLDLVVSGVGKANAAGATVRAFEPSLHAGVISIGVGGALPGSGLDLGSLVIGSRSIYADEGLASPEGFQEVAQMGFAPGSGVRGVDESVGVETSPQIVRAREGIGERTGAIATVSTCSGTDALSAEVVRRTGAIVEAMEGAAVGFSAARIVGGPALFCELRVVSNTTGDRSGQAWDLPGALERLRGVAPVL